MHSDADVGRQGVEDDPGGWLWKEIRRFLRHHLARARDLDHVRDRGRAQEEGRLARSRLNAIEQARDVPGVAEVALRLQLGRFKAQLSLQDLAVKDRHVEAGDWI